MLNSRVFREGGVVLHILVICRPRKSQLGILVSSRTAKHATDRNRIKRKVREFFRTRKNKFLDRYALIVRVVSNIGKEKELDSVLERLFIRAGIMK